MIKLKELARKKRKHVDGLLDSFRSTKKYKSSVQYEDHPSRTVLNEPSLGMILFISHQRPDFVSIEDFNELNNEMLHTVRAWELTVSCSISLPDGGSFHPFAISHPRVFSLARWSLLIHTAFHMPRATRVRALLPFCSPLPLESLLLSFPPATKRFQFARLSLACSWIQQMFERIYSRPYKNRVSFRKAMKKAIELIEQAATKGIQVQIAGRIDGKEMFLAIHMASSNDTSLG
ncbi:ankyrin repeat family protein [Tanacetum coccineum]